MKKIITFCNIKSVSITNVIFLSIPTVGTVSCCERHKDTHIKRMFVCVFICVCA
jgi:hypothetical protein